MQIIASKKYIKLNKLISNLFLCETGVNHNKMYHVLKFGAA